MFVSAAMKAAEVQMKAAKMAAEMQRQMYEAARGPLHPEVNGSDGIPRKGREVAYATELWLENPTAFWLHPEGPLSDTTPEEWKAKEEERRKRDGLAQLSQRQIEVNLQMQASYGLLQAAQASMLQNSQLSALNQHGLRQGNIIGNALGLPF